MAERNVGEARKACERYVAASERMIESLDDAARQTWSGAREANLRMLGFVEANAKAGFDFAARFVQARDASEITALQQDYLREATDRLGRQMRELRELATQTAQEAARSLRPKG